MGLFVNHPEGNSRFHIHTVEVSCPRLRKSRHAVAHSRQVMLAKNCQIIETWKNIAQAVCIYKKSQIIYTLKKLYILHIL